MKKYISISIIILIITLIGIALSIFNPDHPTFKKISEWDKFIGIFGTLISIILGLLAYLSKDKSGMKIHKTPIEKDFPERKFKERLKSFSGFLARDLDKIDQETNWSSELFTPLDAHVVVNSRYRRQQKITDLLKAIRSNQKSKVFLVLGDPGSGKSVALRKLCRELLAEVDKTEKVPLYVNLKEWQAQESWTEQNPPTSKELYHFVLKNLENRADVFAGKFLNDYFERMFDTGRLFLVLDSFDEIPAVLDADESSWIVDQLSTVMYDFMAGAHESRGVLASRMYRRPTHRFDAETKLEIRPFTEEKIIANIQKYFSNSEPITKSLFKDYPGLVPVVRNPFNNALILNFYEDKKRLPDNQTEIYETYIRRRLKDCRERIKQQGLDEEQMLHYSSEIAHAMFSNPKSGLEIALSDLDPTTKKGEKENVLEILCFAKLARLTRSDEKRFSFVHRRFAEFFLASKMIDGKVEVPLEAIPTDSRWRDALVLYCEIAGESDARKIAKFCWTEISTVMDVKTLSMWQKYWKLSERTDELYKASLKTENGQFDIDEFDQQMEKMEKVWEKLKEVKIDISNPNFLRTVHALRFLVSGFYSRSECIDSFQKKLSMFIHFVIERNTNLIASKIAVEAVGLIPSEKKDLLLQSAFSLSNEWISQTALRACRHLAEISKGLRTHLLFYFSELPLKELLYRRKEVLFSLSLSDALALLHRDVKVRLLDFRLFKIGLLTLSISCLILLIKNVFSLLILGAFVLSFIVFMKIYFKAKSLWRFNYSALIRCLSITFILLYLIYFVDVFWRHEISFNMSAIVLLTLLSASCVLIFPWNVWTYLKSYFSFRAIPAYVKMELRKISFKSVIKYVLTLIFWIWIGFLFIQTLFLLLFSDLAHTFFVSQPIEVVSKLFKDFFEVIWSIISRFPKFFMGLVLIGQIGYFILYFHKRLLIPYRIFKKLNFEEIMSREKIDNQFQKCRSIYYGKFQPKILVDFRFKYVRELEKRHVKAVGEWPDGVLPNSNNDAASTLLAQLEERWLGLDR